MDFPTFFADCPAITLRDPLAVLLGASQSGLLNYAYADAVKLAGHSCPTVAGAFLMLRQGLRHIYGDDVPERGSIEVHLRDARDQGVTGVIASVATLVTGAAPETGFGGIGPHRLFARRDLLHFEASIDGLLALRRRDTGRGVVLDLDTSVVPAEPEMQRLFARALAPDAGDGELARFGVLWQARVERMLTHHADDPDLIKVADW